jgi:hypothetical protein
MKKTYDRNNLQLIQERGTTIGRVLDATLVRPQESQARQYLAQERPKVWPETA